MNRYGRKSVLAPGDFPHLIGKGCRFCTDGKPIGHGICQSCWGRVFGWTWERIARWRGRQNRAYERIQERRAAMKRWRESRPHDGSGIIAYAERYGVWLVPEEELNL